MGEYPPISGTAANRIEDTVSVDCPILQNDGLWLQVEDIRNATGGEIDLLENRDHGYFTVDMPNFWERPEMSGMLRDVRQKPDKYEWTRE